MKISEIVFDEKPNSFNVAFQRSYAKTKPSYEIQPVRARTRDACGIESERKKREQSKIEKSEEHHWGVKVGSRSWCIMIHKEAAGQVS